MKKILLSMAVAMSALSLSAEPITIDFSSKDEGMPLAEVPVKDAMTVDEVYSYTFSDVDFKMKNCYNGSSYLMLFAKATNATDPYSYIEFTLPEKLEKFSITTGAGASKNVSVQLSVDGTNIGSAVALNEQAADFNFTIPEANQAAGTTYRLAVVGNKYNSQISKIVFNGNGEVEPPVEPTVNEVANIAAFLEAKDTKNQSKFTSPVTAVYQNGRYLYINDATGNVLVYGDLNTKYTNGDVIPAGITGTYKDFNGLIEFDAPVKDTFLAGTAGTAVAPEEVTIEELSTDMMSTYVVLKGVSIAAAEKANNYTVTDETGEVVLYNQFYNAQYYDVVEVLEGENLTLEAFVSVYNSTVQLVPVKVTSESGIEAVAAPTFNPAGGQVDAGTEVTISCATEGATIYYTLDNSTPTTASTVYTAPIVVNEATHIRAIAVKEGMENSRIAEANYTIANSSVAEGDAFFDFLKPGDLNPAVEAPVSGNPNQNIVLDELNFTNNGVTLVFAPGTSASRMWYDYNKGPQARVYKTGSITITAPEGKLISKVVFNGENIEYLTVDGTNLTGTTWTATEGVDKVEFVAADGRVDFYSIAVYLTEGSGIADIEMNAAPVEYFNLQGVRVENPANGLYIRRQGNKVAKVIL